MADKSCETEEDASKFLNEFISQYNLYEQEELTEQNAKTSDDFLELAEAATSKKKALQYAKKALELESDFTAYVHIVLQAWQFD